MKEEKRQGGQETEDVLTLEEAIKNVESVQSQFSPVRGKWQIDSMQILIEAGKRLQAKRLDHWVLITPLLPGEAEE